MDGKLYDVWITFTFVQKLIWLGLASLTEHMHDSHTYKLDKLGEGIKNNIQQIQVLRQLHNTLASNVYLSIHFCYFNFNHFQRQLLDFSKIHLCENKQHIYGD